MRSTAFFAGLLVTTAICAGDMFTLKPLERTPNAPASFAKTGENRYFVDFGKDAFGYLELEIASGVDQNIEVHLGEKAINRTVDRNPSGSIRYAQFTLPLRVGRRTYRIETSPDKRNTSGDAIKLPEELGVVLPFRYVEIVNCPVDLDASSVRRVTVHYPFDDSASSFSCDNAALNEVWELCKYSIKATSFAGIYVDGDRERIPYEADAYINQLSHYCVDQEYALARHTHEYLLQHPTWPTEWKQHSVLMAHADWMYSGNADSLRRNYGVLKAEKTLTKYARADGLLDTSKLKDIVDWPTDERDGYVMSPVNTVVNAFHYRTLKLMAEMAQAADKEYESKNFGTEAERVKKAFNEKLFDASTGIYVDGEGAAHSSLHANLFALAFGLVPEERKPKVIAFIKSKGMACSVYPAQFLLEGLFENGEAEYAISLITSDGERSWRNMIKAGSTITTEAWDLKFKRNMDWNHAWGAAPANIIPRYVLGVRPLEPGFRRAIVAPQLGKLKSVEGVVPTPLGGIGVRVDERTMQVDVPRGVTADVVLLQTNRKLQVTSGRHVLQR